MYTLAVYESCACCSLSIETPAGRKPIVGGDSESLVAPKPKTLSWHSHCFLRNEYANDWQAHEMIIAALLGPNVMNQANGDRNPFEEVFGSRIIIDRRLLIVQYRPKVGKLMLVC